MISGLFASVTDALISYAIDKLDPAETLKTWLKREPARLAFEKALARAYAAFARQYPEYTSSLFDQSFLSKEALPELSKLLTRNLHPDPALLAQSWGQSIGADINFAQTATKPASYFLQRLEAELKAEPALQALFDSRALDSLPKLEAEIQKLTSELQRGLDIAWKAASDYQKVTLHIEGDVKDSNIIVGDNNQLTINKYYYSGDFVSLNEYYIPPDGVFQRVRVDEFVGRDWLTAKVDAFLNDPSQKSGAFLLVGDAGVGKTAFMAHLVKERRYLHLFAEQVPGQAMLQRALQSLGSQLVTRYQIDPYKDRDTLNVLAGFPDFLERLLRLAASTLTEGEKIVIVCDALDEAGVFPDHFVFGLPKELPDGVYLILSQRPVNTKLPNFEPLRFDLEAQGEDNLQDMEEYLSAVAKRPAVAGQIRAKDYAEDFFIQTLKEKSLGVWMYLHYVIKEIERGQRAPLDLESLPKGLVGYYADYWDNWRSGRKGSDATKWDSLYAPLLATLAAAQEAITVEKLIEWAGVQTTQSEVTRLLNESWSSFITEKEEKGKTVYALYHLSLRDFITGKVDDINKLPPTYASLVSDLSKKKVEAHQRIVNAFEVECKGEWEKLVEQDYPRLHLTAHLNGAKEYKKLTDLLTEGDEKIKWAEVREKKEETYAGYLNDLTYVWDYAEREQNYALAIRCMLIENSIHSLVAGFPPRLLAKLAEAGIWSYARCLEVIGELTKSSINSSDQAESLKLLIANMPKELLQKSFDIARDIKDDYHRSDVLILLLPYLNENVKTLALDEACIAVHKIRNDQDRAYILSLLKPYLTNELKDETIQTNTVLTPSYQRSLEKWFNAKGLLMDIAIQKRTDTLQYALALSSNKEEWRNMLLEVLSSMQEIRDEGYRIYSLTFYILNHLNEDLKHEVLRYSLSVAQESNNERTKMEALIVLEPHLSGDLKSQALLIAQTIQVETYRQDTVDILNLKNNKNGDPDTFKKIMSRFAMIPSFTAIIGNEKDILDSIRYSSQSYRFLGVLHTGRLTATLIHFSGPEIVPELYRSIVDTARWWP